MSCCDTWVLDMQHFLRDYVRCPAAISVRERPDNEYNKRNIFLRKLYGKWGIETFLKKPNMRWKQVVRSLVAIYFDISQLAKSKLYKTLDCWSRDMFNFNFSEKGLGLVSPPYFVYDFSRKMFFMLHSIN